MSQHDMNIANQGFAAFRADLNLALAALASLSAGATAPTTTFAGMFWFDTSTDTLKIRDEGNAGWIAIFKVLANGLAISGSDTLVTDEVNGRVGVNTTGPLFRWHVVDDASGVIARLENILYPPLFDIFRSNNGWVDGDEIGRIRFIGRDGADNAHVYAEIKATAPDVTNLLEDGELTLSALGSNGVLKYVASGGHEFTGPVNAANLNTTGTAGNVHSGTYTPTLTNVANVDASTANSCTFSRVGNLVTVEGVINIDATAAATDTEVGLSLPIASNFTAITQLAGAGACITAGAYGESVAIVADTTNDRARILLRPSGTAGRNVAFTFCYRVL
jgi:hypothetical protein